MTVHQAEKAAPWRTRPGWGITVDLTPPEVLDARYVRRLRRRMATALVVLLVLVLGGFALAARHHASAEGALEDEQLTTTQLQTQARDYQDVTQMQTALTRLRSQLAGVLASDVRVDELSTRLSTALPAGMTITSESITMSPVGAAAGTDTGSASGTDTTIGTVSLSGAARSLDDVAAYVEKLATLEGVSDVVPTSNAKGDKDTVSYTVTLSLTSALLTHRFDATASASPSSAASEEGS